MRVRARRIALFTASVAIVCAGIALPTVLRKSAPPIEPFFLVRVLTWNVGLPHGLGDSRAETAALGKVAGVIADADVDVAVLQELRGDAQLDRILADLGGSYTGATSEKTKTDRVIAVLVRGVATYRQVPSRAGRPKIAATYDAAPRQEVTVIGAHLSAFDPDLRQREAHELVTFARAQTEPILLAGDFNLDPNDSASGARDRGTYDLLTRELRDLGMNAGATTLFGRRVDYVFARPEDVIEASPRVVADRGVGRMDHMPLLVHVGLRVQRPAASE